MTTVAKTREAQDFLALVPRLVGFEPHESVILVAFRGNRTCGAMRFDVPAVATDPVYRSIATTLIGMLCKVRGADAVVPVVYTDDRFGGPERIPVAGFVAALVSRAELSGFTVRDALCVAADGWGSYLDEDCPSAGRPLAAIAASSVHDSIPSPRSNELGGVADGADLPPVDLATTERVARCLDTYRQSLFDSALADTFRTELDLLEDPTFFAECALTLDPDSIDHSIAALLILCLSSPPVRDATMLQWAFDLDVGDRVLEENERFLAGDAVGDAGALILGEGPRPDPERIAAAMALLKSLVARAPRSGRPPLLCMLGWLSWALGRSSLAARFIDSAQQIDARYGFAEVLAAVLAAGHLPDWAFETDRSGGSQHDLAQAVTGLEQFVRRANPREGEGVEDR